MDWVGESDGDAYFFLFSDFLLHCATTGDESEKEGDSQPNEKGFRYVTIVPCNFFKAITESAENPTAFEATFDGEVGTFVAPTEEEKQEWMKHITKCMEDKLNIEFDW